MVWLQILHWFQLKIKYLSSLVKKKDYDTKINEIEKKVSDHNHGKCITTPEFDKFTAKIFAARLAQANLVTETDFDTKRASLNKKFNSNTTKYLLVENDYKHLMQVIWEVKSFWRRRNSKLFSISAIRRIF